MKLNDFDWIGLLAILLLVISAGLFTYYYSVQTFHSCTSNPVAYTITQLAETDYNYSYVEIEVYIDDSEPSLPLEVYKIKVKK